MFAAVIVVIYDLDEVMWWAAYAAWKAKVQIQNLITLATKPFYLLEM
jgi:hypothetical protein